MVPKIELDRLLSKDGSLASRLVSESADLALAGG